jgi:hypothetical protein
VDAHARTRRPAPGQAWPDQLAGAQAGEAAARLQDLLLETARTEMDRRHDQLPPGGPGPGALAQEAATGALAAVIADLGERSQAPFTLWVAKFVMAEVSAKIAQRQWRAGALTVGGGDWSARLPACLGLTAGAEVNWGGVLASLRRGVAEDLSEQQRMVFQSVLLGGVPIDVLALEFGSARSAVYKSLFEARRRLGDRLAADGHDPDPLNPLPSDWPSGLADLLAVTPGDPGCEVTFQEVDSYACIQLRGGDPGQELAAVRVHLGSCAACQLDYQGLLAAGRAGRLPAALRCPSWRPPIVVLVTSPLPRAITKEDPMRYMLLVCVAEGVQLSPGESADMERDTEAWVAEMDGRGVRVLGEALRPVSDATTVRQRGGEVLISDGPFAETKEQIAGFDILECANLDEAIEVAAKHPVARIGTIEVRPFWAEEAGS